ncbi:MAG TPA: S24 family peptidase [Candidatus Angelobacter sp.]|nr:S24 family peptidase [Candidatus Angelobacter sp.]
MKFRQLQENLRRRLLDRISRKELTALRLARQTGFQQPHITNFLNRKRFLSIEAMDRVLAVQKLSVLDLLDPGEINKRASILPPSEDDFENVLLVEGTIAAGEPIITNERVKDILKFKKSFLRRLRPSAESPRDGWLRFVLIKVDAHDGMSMYPRLLPGATVLIDRHYNSLEPYRRQEQNMYAVRHNGGATVKYVELSGRNLVLRPHNQSYPVSIVAIEEDKTFADYIVGRVCHVAIEV